MFDSPRKNAFGTPIASAFTLVELLVVLSIIGVLTALLLPSISKAKENAKVTKSTSNLRGISESIMLFAADHENSLPKAKFFTGSWPDSDWQGQIADYGQPMKVPILESWAGGIYRCPLKSDWSIALGTTDAQRVSYSMNAFTTNSGVEPLTKKIVAIDHPSRVWLVGTSGSGHAAVYNKDFLKRRNPTPRYRDGWIIAFCDGHVQWVPDKDLSFDLTYSPQP